MAAELAARAAAAPPGSAEAKINAAFASMVGKTTAEAKATANYTPPQAPPDVTQEERRAGLSVMDPRAYDGPKPNEHVTETALTELRAALARAKTPTAVG